ncbi:gluconate 2-dehydrogenase subunit 3 family protein [Robertkochia aurantiaca]|uniref:gluconate 2-dehydrogenase subunit 3 family protein n=1 Tax=Robertkochia aurantiaca TaxID=2873700 RepID=UPI001CCD95E3|nr:gluconate 2-dehydrogenase subunit 3 family protein [Robertkochia sp. 3YJGBD-33]
MDRRKALKNIGLSAGFMAATPSIFSLLQSCTTEAESWAPVFFTEEQGIAVKKIVDIILPKTDTPSATEVNVPEFIDRYADEVFLLKEQENFRESVQGMVDKLKSSYDEDLNDIKPEQYEELVAMNLKATPEHEEKMNKLIRSYQGSIEKEEQITKDIDALTFSAMGSLRSMAINAYKISEMVGENVLAYDPVPGGYTGCGSLEELSGGKAWSL